MKVWIVFDVIRTGIREADLIKDPFYPDTIGVYVVFSPTNCKQEWFPDGSWFKTKKGAIKAADRQRNSDIVCLERQINRLKAMVFE